jgi:uncharacterized protein
MSTADIVAAVAISIGVLGIIVPVVPGSLLIGAAILLWSAEVGSDIAWTAAAVAVTVLIAGNIAKFALPGKQLKAAVPAMTLMFGLVGAVVGFFVIPVAGALVGFPLGVYLAERQRVGRETARHSTAAALRAIGVGILIELLAGIFAAGSFFVGAALT